MQSGFLPYRHLLNYLYGTYDWGSFGKDAQHFKKIRVNKYWIYLGWLTQSQEYGIILNYYSWEWTSNLQSILSNLITESQFIILPNNPLPLVLWNVPSFILSPHLLFKNPKNRSYYTGDIKLFLNSCRWFRKPKYVEY